MKPHVFILLLFISINFLTSCKKEENSPTSQNPINNTDVLVPLSVGNYWVYFCRTIDSTGKVWAERYDTVSVTRDTTIDGERWYFLYPIDGWVTNRQYGYWYRYGKWITLFCPYPSKAGDSLFISNGAILHTQSIQDTVYCSAGRFICYRFSDGYYIYKYSPNIGLVYSEPIFSSNYRGDRKFLSSYKIK